MTDRRQTLAGRIHAANAPVPKRLVPRGGFAPPHPYRDAQGRPAPFDPARHAAFRSLLDRSGDRRLVAVKRARRMRSSGRT